MTFPRSVRGPSPGIENLGIQVDTREELAWVRCRFAQVDAGATQQAPIAQADGKNDSHLLMDPQGILWEATQTAIAGPSAPESSGKA